MPLYRVLTKHDAGTARIVTFASDAETAAQIVCKAEGCPPRAITKITEVKPKNTRRL